MPTTTLHRMEAILFPDKLQVNQQIASMESLSQACSSIQVAVGVEVIDHFDQGQNFLPQVD